MAISHDDATPWAGTDGSVRPRSRRVDHRHNPADRRRIGRQIERAVLARAVARHAEDRVLVHGNTTVVFA